MFGDIDRIFRDEDSPLADGRTYRRKVFIHQREASSQHQQQAISSNLHAGKAGDGGSRSARTNDHGRSERRRRQSKSKIVGGGLGMDSTADKGAGRRKVRFVRTRVERNAVRPRGS